MYNHNISPVPAQVAQDADTVAVNYWSDPAQQEFAYPRLSQLAVKGV